MPTTLVTDYYCSTCQTWTIQIRGSDVSIGSPFRACPKCTDPIRVNNIKEWEQISISDKIAHFGQIAVVSAAITTFLIFPATAILERIAKPTFDQLGIPALWLIIALLWTAVCCYRAIMRIRDSQQRMSNPDYRARVLSALPTSQ